MTKRVSGSILVNVIRGVEVSLLRTGYVCPLPLR